MNNYKLSIRLLACLLTIVASSKAGRTQEILESDAVFLSVNQAGEADCSFPSPETENERFSSNGLLLWKTGDGAEVWKSVQKGEAWPKSDEVEVPADMLNRASRGIGNSPNASLGSLGIPTTLRLEPLTSAVLTRGSVLISPQANASVLSSFPTLRRTSDDGELLRAKVLIYQGGQLLIDIPWASGQSALPLRDVDALQKKFPAGLAPNTYTIKLEEEGKIKETQFMVAGVDEQQLIARSIAEFKDLVDKNDPSPSRIAPYFEVEMLLAYVDPSNRPIYLTDALDAIERQSNWDKDAFLSLKQREITKWLSNLARDPDYSGGLWASESNTSVASDDPFNTIRTLIGSGQWNDALNALTRMSSSQTKSEDPLFQPRCDGYLAVVYSESGPFFKSLALESFVKAIEELQRIDTAESKQELSRVQNNFANFHLLMAQNTLHNHAFQIAAGTPQPLLTTANHLAQAKEFFRLSLATKQVSKVSELTTKVNLARVYLCMADLVGTLVLPEPDEAMKMNLEKAMYGGASSLLKSIIAESRESHGADDVEVEKLAFIGGSAIELLSQIAYRNSDWDSAERYSAESIERYLNLGFFPGLESTYRLRALIYDARQKRPEAIRNMRISKLLAEVNRARFPADRTGQSRAGFFARQVVIYEKLAEWYLLEGDPTTALGYVEQAKSRATQDLLELHRGESSESSSIRDVPTILQNLPSETSVVEYFLTAERGWGFLLQKGKPVRSFELKAVDGSQLASQELLARCRRLLSSMEGQAPKMMRRLMSGKGIDNSWQNELFELRSILLPDEIMGEIRQTRSLVVIPQHILHYLPFAALVVKLDESKLEKNAIAKPRFLVDEELQLINSPSLTTWDISRNRIHAPFKSVNAVGLVSAPGAPPLPGVEKDLINLKEVFGSRVRKVVEDDQATEWEAAALLGETGLLMLATHGFNDADKPLDSYLLFRGEVDEEGNASQSDSREDGRLTAREILSHQVNARLVVMSACYSGLGDRSPQPGDDLFGLQRSFLQSGARCVLSGLWDVYDGTAPQLIREFYEELQRSSSPSSALPKAQRAFLNRLRESDKLEPWLHPYFWSVFNLCGAD